MVESRDKIKKILDEMSEIFWRFIRREREIEATTRKIMADVQRQSDQYEMLSTLEKISKM